MLLYTTLYIIIYYCWRNICLGSPSYRVYCAYALCVRLKSSAHFALPNNIFIKKKNLRVALHHDAPIVECNNNNHVERGLLRRQVVGRNDFRNRAGWTWKTNSISYIVRSCWNRSFVIMIDAVHPAERFNGMPRDKLLQNHRNIKSQAQYVKYHIVNCRTIQINGLINIPRDLRVLNAYQIHIFVSCHVEQ